VEQVSYFIIIRGPLGCGKSTISRELAGRLNAEYVSIDKLLEENNLDKISPKEECIPAKNFIKANEMIIPKAKQLLQKNKIVIFDACFYHKEPIEHLIQNLQFQHYVFTLKASVETCIERDRKRGKTHGEAAARAVHKLVSRFDYGIIIDITKPIDESIEEIMSYLPE
jgi:shikimate kinase